MAAFSGLLNRYSSSRFIDKGNHAAEPDLHYALELLYFKDLKQIRMHVLSIIGVFSTAGSFP